MSINVSKPVAARKIARYGWRPDRPDFRDHMFVSHPSLEVTGLPESVDLREHCPPVMDQGELGSCTAHGITGAMRFNRIKQGLGDIELSRLQIYYDERAVEGTISQDAGAEIRDGVKVANKNGVGRESLWPYVISKFKRKPAAKCYTDAKKDVATAYERVTVSATAIKQALASGFPVVIGISVYESFESDEAAKTGMIPMPGKGEQMIGGHCMYVVGYGQKPGYFTVRNSWGTSWGDNGDCYLPESYLGSTKFGSDYWVVKSIGPATKA